MSNYEEILSEKARTWLIAERGLSEEIIEKYGIGYNGREIVIPIKDRHGEHVFNKYRRNPFIKSEDQSKYRFDKGATAQIYGWEHINEPKDRIVICEGEFDKLVLETHGISAITGTNGAPTFKDEWVEHIKELPSEVFICMDSDYAGLKATEKLSGKLLEARIIELPDEGGVKDVTDFVNKHGIEKFRVLMDQARGLEDIKEEKRVRLWEESREKFPPITLDDVKEVLDLTIKKDDTNKLIVFLGMLSAYTEEAQLNITLNAPSSTGKTYIPMEISELFPKEDVIKKDYCSPTAFFHEKGEYDKEKDVTLVDLERKIVIFRDQPNPALLIKLRPLLSHDDKYMIISITDKTKNSRNRTKNIVLKGYCAFVFCSAGIKMDEQECTRFILLSPDIDTEKIRLAIKEKIKKEKDQEAYCRDLKNNSERLTLIERIKVIKDLGVGNFRISNADEVEKRFFAVNSNLIARHQRDIGRLFELIKAVALLNAWHRERVGAEIVTTNEDFESAWKLWIEISRCQDLNLSPYAYEILEEVIVPEYELKGAGLTRQEIIKKYKAVKGQNITDTYLKNQVLKALDASGLIYYEKDDNDKRRSLIIPIINSNRGDEIGMVETGRPVEPYLGNDIGRWSLNVEQKIDEESIESGVYIPGEADGYDDEKVPF